MTTTEQAERKQDELERLLNDPEVPMQASRVWALAAEVAALSSDLSTLSETHHSIGTVLARSAE